MIYDLKTYKTEQDLEDDRYCTYVTWETEEKNAYAPCGKLLRFAWNLSMRSVIIPDGVEIIGREVFSRVNSSTVLHDLCIEEVVIPATVKTIEEGAFAGTMLGNIKLDADATCGIIKSDMLYSGDGKTLLWVLGDAYSNAEDVCVIEHEHPGVEGERHILVVPEGVERIASDFAYDDAWIDVIQLPASVKEIGIPEYEYNDDYFPTIRAPKGSEAIRIAKGRGWEYEETDPV